MSARRASCTCLFALSVLAAVLVWGDWGGPARTTLGLLLVCLLPGLAALVALDLRPRPLEGLAIGLAVSFAVAVLVGIALGASHVGFGARAWATSLAAITVLICAAGFLTPDCDRDECSARTRTRRFPRRLTDAGLFLFALGLAAAAIAIARHSAVRHLRAVPIGEVWLLPSSAPASGRVGVGVRNLAPSSRSFALTVRAPGRRIEQTLTLAANASRVQSFPLGTPAAQGPVTATLQNPRYPAASESASLSAVVYASGRPHRSRAQKRRASRRRAHRSAHHKHAPRRGQ